MPVKGDESMVTVTDQAAQLLRATLAQARTQPGQTLRVSLKPEGGFGLSLDQKRNGDQAFTLQGETILLMAPDVAEALDEATIDTENTDGRRKIVISR
jgi:Fe-S cluster assembly iron-binding protein IscA